MGGGGCKITELGLVDMEAGYWKIVIDRDEERK